MSQKNGQRSVLLLIYNYHGSFAALLAPPPDPLDQRGVGQCRFPHVPPPVLLSEGVWDHIRG